MQAIEAIRQTINSIKIMSIDGLADLLEDAARTEADDGATDLSHAQLANGEHVLIVQGRAAAWWSFRSSIRIGGLKPLQAALQGT